VTDRISAKRGSQHIHIRQYQRSFSRGEPRSSCSKIAEVSLRSTRTLPAERDTGGSELLRIPFDRVASTTLNPSSIMDVSVTSSSAARRRACFINSSGSLTVVRICLDISQHMSICLKKSSPCRGQGSRFGLRSCSCLPASARMRISAIPPLGSRARPFARASELRPGTGPYSFSAPSRCPQACRRTRSRHHCRLLRGRDR
jgi:hypothetical protein